MEMSDIEREMLATATKKARANLNENCDEKKVNKLPAVLAIRDALFNEDIQEYNGSLIERRFDMNGRTVSRVIVGNIDYITQDTGTTSPWAKIAYYTNTKIVWIRQRFNKNRPKWKNWMGILVNGELYQFDLNNYGHKWRIRYAHLLEHDNTPASTAPEPEPAATERSNDFYKGLLKEFSVVTDEVVERMEDLIQRGVTQVTEEDVTFFLNWKEKNTAIIETAVALTVIMHNIDTSIKYFEAKTRSADAVKNTEVTDIANGSGPF